MAEIPENYPIICVMTVFLCPVMPNDCTGMNDKE